MATETPNEVYSGNVGGLWIQNEVTYGTDPGSWTTNKKTLGLLTPDCTMTAKNNLVKVYGIGSRLQQADVATKFDVSGSINGSFQIGRFLSFLIGTDTKAGAGPYTHKFDTPSGTLPSFSMLVMRGSTATSYVTNETYTGCKFNSCTFKGTLDAPLDVSLDLIAQTVSYTQGAATGSTMAYDGDVVHPPQFGTLTLGGNVVADVQSCDITISNNCTPVFGLGSRLAQQIVPTTFGMDVRISAIFNDVGALNRIKAFTGDTSTAYTPAANTDIAIEAFDLTYTNSGLTTALRKIQFDITNCKWDEMSVVARSGSTVTVDMSGHIYTLGTNAITTTDANNVVFPA